MDVIDTCLICGQEIPPGPDFCSDVCEERAKIRREQAINMLRLSLPKLSKDLENK